MEKTCPRCRLINPPEAVRCDCGWVFGAGGAENPASAALPDPRAIAARAKASWICPLAAWVSQIVLAVTLRGASGLAFVWLVAMVVQFVLIVAGLSLGMRVLSLGRAAVPPPTWWAAAAGVALSGGTILLIAGVAVFSSL